PTGGTSSTTVSMMSASSTVQPLSTLAFVGTYLIIVTSVIAGNACASFAISKSQATSASASIFRMSSSVGVNTNGGEELYMSWGASTYPGIYHSQNGTQGTSLVYNVRITTN
ncbi:MAG: hypothetical protein WB421_17335, partial [Terriglobales bacterium]